MVKIPIVKKLKKRSHLQISLAQDLLVIEIYNFFPKAVIHGGTAIWRCLEGNRFSEDVDVYLPPASKEKLEAFQNNLKGNGFIIEKFKKTNGTIFSKLKYQEQIIRFEGIFKNIKNYLTANYELADGTFIVVNVLAPEYLIKEKTNAYLSRRKIRDLYDIFFLLKKVGNKKIVKSSLRNLLKNFKEPADENDLKALIIIGAVPKLSDMLREIEKWAK